MFALFHSSMIGTNFNFSCYSSPEVDKLLTDGKTETNTEKRKAIYLQAEQKVMEDAVFLPMVDELSVGGFKANVNGLGFDGYTYPHFSDVYLTRRRPAGETSVAGGFPPPSPIRWVTEHCMNRFPLGRLVATVPVLLGV